MCGCHEVPHTSQPHTSHLTPHTGIYQQENISGELLCTDLAPHRPPHFPTNISLKMRQWRCVCILLTFNCKSFLTLGDQVPSLMSYITPSLSHSKEFLLQTKKKTRKRKFQCVAVVSRKSHFWSANYFLTDTINLFLTEIYDSVKTTLTRRKQKKYYHSRNILPI